MWWPSLAAGGQGTRLGTTGAEQFSLGGGRCSKRSVVALLASPTDPRGRRGPARRGRGRRAPVSRDAGSGGGRWPAPPGLVVNAANAASAEAGSPDSRRSRPFVDRATIDRVIDAAAAAGRRSRRAGGHTSSRPTSPRRRGGHEFGDRCRGSADACDRRRNERSHVARSSAQTPQGLRRDVLTRSWSWARKGPRAPTRRSPSRPGCTVRPAPAIRTTSNIYDGCDLAFARGLLLERGELALTCSASASATILIAVEGRNESHPGGEVVGIRRAQGALRRPTLSATPSRCLLGAAALGHRPRFPDTDPQDTRALTALACSSGRSASFDEAGYVVENVDAVVIVEQPKAGAARDVLRAVAGGAGVHVGAVSVKGKTNEGMARLDGPRGRRRRRRVAAERVRGVRCVLLRAATGQLHVSNARTAPFTGCSRNAGAPRSSVSKRSIAERSTLQSEQSIIEDLRWLGLDWDEGPDAGGEVGPGRQSERLDLDLRTCRPPSASGHAGYHCFCWPSSSTPIVRRLGAASLPPAMPPVSRADAGDGSSRRAAASGSSSFPCATSIGRHFADVVRGPPRSAPMSSATPSCCVRRPPRLNFAVVFVTMGRWA